MFFETLEDVHLAVAEARNEKYSLEMPEDIPFWTLETVFLPSFFSFLFVFRSILFIFTTLLLS